MIHEDISARTMRSETGRGGKDGAKRSVSGGGGGRKSEGVNENGKGSVGEGFLVQQDCWKCGKVIDGEREQYFCVCGVVQPPIDKRSFFQVIGVKETFDIDTKELTERFRNLQRFLHPDKYSQKSEKERAFSAAHSALVNRAYATLLRPLSRGLYMLRVGEEELEHAVHGAVEQDFLAHILDLNEQLLEAGHSLSALQRLSADSQRVLAALERRISEAFKRNDPTEAKRLLYQLKYYANIDDKIRELIRRFSDEL